MGSLIRHETCRFPLFVLVSLVSTTPVVRYIDGNKPVVRNRMKYERRFYTLLALAWCLVVLLFSAETTSKEAFLNWLSSVAAKAEAKEKEEEAKTMNRRDKEWRHARVVKRETGAETESKKALLEWLSSVAAATAKAEAEEKGQTTSSKPKLLIN